MDYAAERIWNSRRKGMEEVWFSGVFGEPHFYPVYSEPACRFRRGGRELYQNIIM